MTKRMTKLNTERIQPDDVLAAFLGSKRPITRTEITKKVWAYIKKHRLQDPRDRRLIETFDTPSYLSLRSFGESSPTSNTPLHELFNHRIESTCSTCRD